MANWVTNKFTCKGTPERIKELKDFVLTIPEGARGEIFDFDKIIPMPKELNISSSLAGNRYLDLLQAYPDTVVKDSNQFLWIITSLTQYNDKNGTKHLIRTVGEFIAFLETNPGIEKNLGVDLELGKKYLSNIEKYGYPNRRKWRIINWGTKWSAHDTYIAMTEDNEFRGTFDTAWDVPMKIWEKVANHFPDIEINVDYLDELLDFGGTLTSDGKGGLTDDEVHHSEIPQFAHDVFGFELWDEEEEE